MKNSGNSPLKASIRNGVQLLVCRPLYLLLMVVLPLLFAFGFINLLDSGLPQKSPVAVVDLDGTPVSRTLTQNLNSQMLISVDYAADSYESASRLVREGKIFGFFVIPRNFAADAGAGRETAIPFYCNMSYFVPGTMAYEAIMKVAVTTKGELVAATAVGAGVTPIVVSNLLSPVSPQTNAIGNPWVNYNIYLSNSFIPCLFQLVIFQITAFTMLIGIKRRNSDKELALAGGSVVKYVLGRLIPQFIVFFAVGMALLGIMFGFNHFPMNGNFGGMILDMTLLIIASQAVGLFIASMVPNLRFAVSIASLVGILSFSLAGFSYPVEDMAGAVGILSYILPVRYYFLIYINTALNGYELYYVGSYFLALLLFVIPPMFLLRRLRKNLANPVYIP